MFASLDCGAIVGRLWGDWWAIVGRLRAIVAGQRIRRHFVVIFRRIRRVRMRTLTLLIAFSLTALGQRHKIEEVNSEKPEGKLLQQIMQENDAAKKTALLDQFASQFPKDAGTPWVLEQLQGIYVKANDI